MEIDIVPEARDFNFRCRDGTWYFVDSTGFETQVEQIRIIANGDGQVCACKSIYGLELILLSKIPKEKIVQRFQGDLLVFDFKKPLDVGTTTFALLLSGDLDDASKSFLSRLLRTGPCVVERARPFGNLFLEHMVAYGL